MLVYLYMYFFDFKELQNYWIDLHSGFFFQNGEHFLAKFYVSQNV